MEAINTKTHPGIYVPPPLIYVAIFFCSILIQRFIPLDRSWLDTTAAKLIGWGLIAIYLILFLTALRQFIKSKNTLVTIKPANSLQTKGIYAFSRNPMYLSLLVLYCGIAVFKGNWWTFLFLPLLIIVIQSYVIRKEEHYLHNAFGAEYDAYMKKIRRWI